MKHKYTNEEIEYLRQNAHGTKSADLTKMFNEQFNLTVTESAITNQLHKNNIKIGVRFGCFKKGQVPFNKGLKREDYMSIEGQEKCLKTQFKSEDHSYNNANHNEKEYGSKWFIKDGYIAIKVKPNEGFKRIRDHSNWTYKHWLEWEKVNGRIPKGYKVIFADGNNKNFDIDNLILVSCAELLIMNSNGLYYKGFAEGTKTGALISKMLMKGKKRQNAERGK